MKADGVGGAGGSKEQSGWLRHPLPGEPGETVLAFPGAGVSGVGWGRGQRLGCIPVPAEGSEGPEIRRETTLKTTVER